MKSPLLIYGNGNMARMLYEFLKQQFEVIAFTVDDACINSTHFCGLPLAPFSTVERRYSPKEHCMIIAVGFIAMNKIRDDKYREAKEKGYKFANYIHPTVVRHDTVTFGENNIVLDYASIHPYCSLGNSNFISSMTNLGHDCVVGNSCWINSGVSLAGEVKLNDNCFLGVNVAISHRVSLGSRNFIGANTLVNKDTDEDTVLLSDGGEKFPLTSEAFIKFTKMI